MARRDGMGGDRLRALPAPIVPTERLLLGDMSNSFWLMNG
jgi:hypothetical protein